MKTLTNYQMIYPSGIKKLILAFAFVLAGLPLLAINSITVPPRPNPPRLVNDLSTSGILSADEEQTLENKLDQFANNTSNQIAIVILDSLNDYEPSEYATEIGHQWGIGQKKFDNGIVVLIAPRLRKLFIAVGYGLEGAIPDATCELIIQNEMVPQFKQGNYYEGINKAVTVLMGLAQGEFNSKDYAKKSNAGNKAEGLIIAIIIIIIVLVISRRGGGRGGYTIGNSGIFFWGGLLGGGRSGGGGFGGLGGGGGGGFGGFGGGSFGGGGAGGSW
jgi:uncharacterized protein